MDRHPIIEIIINNNRNQFMTSPCIFVYVFTMQSIVSKLILSAYLKSKTLSVFIERLSTKPAK